MGRGAFGESVSDICSISSTDYFTGKVLIAGFYILIFISSHEKEVMGYDILEDNPKPKISLQDKSNWRFKRYLGE